MMRGIDFLDSKWVAWAKLPEAADFVRREFARWLKKVQNSKLLAKAGRLWKYFQSDKISTQDKVVVIAALLYLISPMDLIPDWIPGAGLLDDLGVATFVLNWLLKKANPEADIEGTENKAE
jgi:uncharacterized membrane protein YkvA (DUF1232 family)